MASEAPAAQTYGQSLPDQVERITKLFDAHLDLVNDVQELYVARVALEREYAAKLQILTRKAAEKKAKMESSFILGDDPSKAWDGQTLKRSTLNNAYDEMISSTTNMAQDHVNLADAFSSNTIDALRTLAKKNEEAKKKETQFFQKLLSDRDRIFSERLKSKQKYDEDCAEVETTRQKQGRAGDDRHADRVARQAEQQKNEMLNSKNLYLISTSIANTVQTKFYGEDIPQVEDEFQALQEHLVHQVVAILRQSHALYLTHLDTVKSRITKVNTKLAEVDTIADQNLFIQYNLRTFIAPEDWKFEPCPVHYDTGDMSVEETPKVFMQNKLRQCREKLHELEPLVRAKREEANRLSPKTAGEISQEFLEAKHQVAFYTTSESILKAEIEAIVAGVGDIGGIIQPHTFKPSTFSIPTQCNYCKSSIWGLSKHGKTCKGCGISVHAKCELKVPANCEGGSPEAPRSSTLFRSSTKASRRSEEEPSGPAMVPSASSFVHPPAAELQTETHPEARVLFDFAATSEFELEVAEGAFVRILEPDDGSGWIKVIDDSGQSGLVPASYLETLSGGSADGGTVKKVGKRVRALYPYQARSPDELDLAEGEILDLSTGPGGGQNFGNGWWEGLNAQRRKGIFPSNYVELI